jgi:alanine racemase
MALTTNRRRFLRTSAAAALGAAVTGSAPPLSAAVRREGQTGAHAGEVHARDVAPPNYEPWLEVDAEAVRHNAREVHRLADRRPIIAVVKNNGYGLGTARVGAVLDRAPEVATLAVVKPAEALALRDAGVTKPILFMGLADAETGVELARRDVPLAPFTDDAPSLLGEVSRAVGRPVPIHLYIDTGINRVGMPYHRALPWLAALAENGAVRIEGAFMTFTERADFDPEQFARFRRLMDDAAARGIQAGALHAASSNGVFFQRDALLDRVRTGLVLYGAFPAGARELGLADLRPAFRLRARVVRGERLRPGDSVSYGRNYVADRPVWIATVPAGHADGYHRTAVQGARVLIGGRTYAVIGPVSASHTIVEVGDERTVAPGDVATLVGPDHEDIHPNTVAERAGISVYDVLMRLSPLLPVRETAA